MTSSSESLAGVVHIAGNDVRVDHLLRQRCSWCGLTLVDYDLTRVAVPEGHDPTPATWPVGGLVLVDGNMKATVGGIGQDVKLPANACALIDPTVTA
ncbi:hypothetical protein [Actinosynnema sp. NPDC023587]|uniref:hypothetical protein n=1 Tax=Actinosynnema sp. NPDC023587 TaxID=3154695 RepID=UPI0033C05634